MVWWAWNLETYPEVRRVPRLPSCRTIHRGTRRTRSASRRSSRDGSPSGTNALARKRPGACPRVLRRRSSGCGRRKRWCGAARSGRLRPPGRSRRSRPPWPPGPPRRGSAPSVPLPPPPWRSKSPPAVYVSQRNAVQFCSRLDFRGFGLGAQWAGGAVAGLDGARFDRTGRSTGRGRTQERRTDPQEGGRQTTLSASANFKLRNSKEKLLERGKAKHHEVITLPARGGGSACGVERGPKWIRYDKIR